MCLAALAMGLRLMSTALVGMRANVLGRIHLHCLLCFPTGNSSTPPRMAKLTIQKITRPSQAKFLYFVLTMNVLFFDEIGQLSAQQIDALDIILRMLQNTDIPFMAAYITRLGALNRRRREELEQRWKYYRCDAIMNGNYSIGTHIESGKCVVQEYNNSVLCDIDRIKLIVTIKRKKPQVA